MVSPSCSVRHPRNTDVIAVAVYRKSTGHGAGESPLRKWLAQVERASNGSRARGRDPESPDRPASTSQDPVWSYC